MVRPSRGSIPPPAATMPNATAPETTNQAPNVSEKKMGAEMGKRRRPEGVPRRSVEINIIPSTLCGRGGGKSCFLFQTVRQFGQAVCRSRAQLLCKSSGSTFTPG